MLSDEDVRHFAIELLTAPTARDQQTRIGVSDLSNGCDFCLACRFLGISRETPVTSRAWGGRVLGTAIHSIFEQRMNQGLEELRLHDGLDEAGLALAKSQLAQLAERYPDALVEQHMEVDGLLGSYGTLGSTPDLVLPSERQAFDWKGTTRAKMAVIKDFLAINAGSPAPYGRTHQVHKAKTLSEKAYADELGKLEYKVTSYYGQTQGYGLMMNRFGVPIERLSLVFVARDDTMWFDNPAGDRFDDPSALHGISVLSFDYDESYALGLMARGRTIWEGLESGKKPSDYVRNEHCFPCGLDGPAVNAPIIIPADEPVLAA